jgi:hypothetical protein
MQSKTTRIAYLKRMLKRLEGEDLRIQGLLSTGELSHEAAELAGQQLTASRNKLLNKLAALQNENPTV